MKKTHFEKCPLCQSVTSNWVIDNGRRKQYDCLNCHRFQVLTNAEAKLREMMETWRKQMSAAAKFTPKGHTLVIRLSNEVESNQHTNEIVTGEYISNSELPNRIIKI